MATQTTAGMYTLIQAPGYHGDYVRVVAAYAEIEKARAKARQGGLRIVTGVDCHQVGDLIPRASVRDLIARGDWTVVA